MKSTDAEIQIRIDAIFDLVVSGFTRKYIVRYCSEKYNISSRQTDEYLQRVYLEVKENYPKEKKTETIQRHLAYLDKLYQKNFVSEDYRECRNIIETKNKMLGLNEVERYELDFVDAQKEITFRIVNDDK